MVLPAELTTFVLISSDLDFNSSVASLSSKGFRVIVMHHEERHHGDLSRKYLNLSASQVVSWESVVANAAVVERSPPKPPKRGEANRQLDLPPQLRRTKRPTLGHFGRSGTARVVLGLEPYQSHV